jgi:hypothetical protein
MRCRRAAYEVVQVDLIHRGGRRAQGGVCTAGACREVGGGVVVLLVLPGAADVG